MQNGQPKKQQKGLTPDIDRYPLLLQQLSDKLCSWHPFLVTSTLQTRMQTLNALSRMDSGQFAIFSAFKKARIAINHLNPCSVKVMPVIIFIKCFQ